MKRYMAVFSGILALVIFNLHGYGLCDYFARLRDYFIPAGKVCVSVEDLRTANVRKIPIRPDGLMTVEIARVLYRSNDVIEYHARLQDECSGVAEQEIKKRAHEAYEQNSDHAVFFVSLYGTRVDWAFTLCKDGVQYKAAEIIRVELDRNYRHIFGTEAFRYTQNIYRVTFNGTLTPPFDVIVCNGKYKAHGTW